MNIFRDLTAEEEEEFRQWARDNFIPDIDVINNLWHPVIQDECMKMINDINNKHDNDKTK